MIKTDGVSARALNTGIWSDAEHPRDSHLTFLEGQSFHILRVVVSDAEHPVMMYSVGKDTAVLLDLAKKRFIQVFRHLLCHMCGAAQ